jgi:hypothetical protein
MLGHLRFFEQTLGQGVFVLLNAHFQRSACFTDVTSDTFTWNTIHTLLRLLDIPNRPTFHQCPTECLFSFEDGPNIEAVPNASDFFGNTPNIGDNDCALLYCIWRRTVASPRFHYGINELLRVLIKY